MSAAAPTPVVLLMDVDDTQAGQDLGTPRPGAGAAEDLPDVRDWRWSEP